MQPAATTFAPVSAAASSVSMESRLAFSTNPQVLTRTTSAPSPSVVTSQPSPASRAASSSESTSLRAQPSVSNATRRWANASAATGTGGEAEIGTRLDYRGATTPEPTHGTKVTHGSQD